jgi:hypothetical protein
MIQAFHRWGGRQNDPVGVVRESNPNIGLENMLFASVALHNKPRPARALPAAKLAARHAFSAEKS